MTTLSWNKSNDFTRIYRHTIGADCLNTMYIIYQEQEDGASLSEQCDSNHNKYIFQLSFSPFFDRGISLFKL